jgi:hypothetical protein
MDLIRWINDPNSGVRILDLRSVKTGLSRSTPMSAYAKNGHGAQMWIVAWRQGRTVSELEYSALRNCYPRAVAELLADYGLGGARASPGQQVQMRHRLALAAPAATRRTGLCGCYLFTFLCWHSTQWRGSERVAYYFTVPQKPEGVDMPLHLASRECQALGTLGLANGL